MKVGVWWCMGIEASELEVRIECGFCVADSEESDCKPLMLPSEAHSGNDTQSSRHFNAVVDEIGQGGSRRCRGVRVEGSEATNGSGSSSCRTPGSLMFGPCADCGRGSLS